MKIEETLIRNICEKLGKRQVIMIKRAKLFFYSMENWVENCRGFLILYRLGQAFYICII